MGFIQRLGNRYLSKVYKLFIFLVVLKILLWLFSNAFQSIFELHPEKSISKQHLQRKQGVQPILGLSSKSSSHKLCDNIVKVRLKENTTDYIPKFISTRQESPGLYFHAAFHDDRLSSENQYFIRVLGMLDRNHLDFLDQLHCLLWYKDSDIPYSTKASGIVIWKYYGAYQGVLISCPFPKTSDFSDIPNEISITDKTCEWPTHYVKVQTKSIRNRKARVAVCAKVIYGKPDAVRLVEWVEMNRLLGVEKIYMYNSSIKGEANKVLAYYHKEGFVQFNEHSFPDLLCRKALKKHFPTNDYNQNWELELMSMNDCLYSADEKYLLNIDIDELLFQDVYPTWKESIEKFLLKNYPGVSSYVFHTGGFVNEFGVDNSSGAPQYLHMLNHPTRTWIDWESPKSIFNADITLALGHHVSMKTLNTKKYKQRMDVPPVHGYVRHYRRYCNVFGEPNKCEKMLKQPHKDFKLNKYKDELIKRVYPVLRLFNLV